MAILELQTVLQSQAMLTLLKCHQISVNNLTDTQCLNPASPIKSLNKSQNQKENSGISTHKVHIINHFNCLLKLFDLIKSFPKPIGQFIGVNRNALPFLLVMILVEPSKYHGVNLYMFHSMHLSLV